MLLKQHFWPDVALASPGAQSTLVGELHSFPGRWCSVRPTPSRGCSGPRSVEKQRGPFTLAAPEAGTGSEMPTWCRLQHKPPLCGQLHSCITLQCQNFCFHPHCRVAAQPLQDFGTCCGACMGWDAGRAFACFLQWTPVTLPSSRSLLLLELPLLNTEVLTCCYCHIIVQLSHNLLFGSWPYLQPFRTLPTLVLLLFGGTEIEVGKLLFKVFRLVDSSWALLESFS